MQRARNPAVVGFDQVPTPSVPVPHPPSLQSQPLSTQHPTPPSLSTPPLASHQPSADNHAPVTDGAHPSPQPSVLRQSQPLSISAQPSQPQHVGAGSGQQADSTHCDARPPTHATKVPRFDPTPAYDRVTTGLQDHKVHQLQELCRQSGLPVSGTKQKLIKILRLSATSGPPRTGGAKAPIRPRSPASTVGSSRPSSTRPQQVPIITFFSFFSNATLSLGHRQFQMMTPTRMTILKKVRGKPIIHSLIVCQSVQEGSTAGRHEVP